MVVDVPQLAREVTGRARRRSSAKRPAGRSPSARRKVRSCSLPEPRSPGRRRDCIQLARLARQGLQPAEGRPAEHLGPFGIKSVRAKVYKDPSWFDSKETIVLDYSKTSLRRAEGQRRDPRGLTRASTSGSSSGRRDKILVLRADVRRAEAAMPHQRRIDDRRPGPAGRGGEPARSCSRRWATASPTARWSTSARSTASTSRGFVVLDETTDLAASRCPRRSST